MGKLPTPKVDTATDWVAAHLGHLYDDAGGASSAFRGGQTAADEALASYDVAGYAAQRNEVLPAANRGASRLSPYIRYNLLQLQRVWDHVEGGPARDVSKFRFELLWQEYARHWYATHGTATRSGTRRNQDQPNPDAEPWIEEMACVSANLDGLHTDGWVVNQARMWLASQWSVRNDAPWREGEDWFFRHLVDGSRAANRLGWQWVGGLSVGKVYGFSRRQVLKRAPELCPSCPLVDNCPIVSWPDQPSRAAADKPEERDLLAGPSESERSGAPEAVWITAESMGDDDPALSAHPDLPAVFVFDEPLLARLRLSSKRLVFLAETLADLARRREVEVRLGIPATELGGRPVAVTYAPVPGFQRLRPSVNLAALHPYPWLHRPEGRPVSSFSAWNRHG